MNPQTLNDQQMVANTLRQQAETIRVLVQEGFDRKTVVAAVCSGDLTGLAR